MKAEKQVFWERMFATHRFALRRFLQRRIGPAWDVEDIAQEAYARMLRIDEKRSDAITDPRAYLFTVASNLIKERAVMQRRAALNVDIEEVLPSLEAPQGSAEDAAWKEFRRQRLARTLARLPPRCKAVLLMQHRDGMSYEEIAKHFGVSTHMVKKYVVRALLLCRRDLADEG